MLTVNQPMVVIGAMAGKGLHIKKAFPAIPRSTEGEAASFTPEKHL